MLESSWHTLILLLKGGGPNFSPYVYEPLLAFLTVLLVGDYWFPSTSEEEKKLLALSQKLFPSIQTQCSFQYFSRPTKRYISPYSTVFACPLNIVQVDSTLNALSPNDLRGYSLLAQITWKCETRRAQDLNSAAGTFETWPCDWPQKSSDGSFYVMDHSSPGHAERSEANLRLIVFSLRFRRAPTLAPNWKGQGQILGGECCSISR